ncbi:MAG: exodeoxyribonuclease III [Deltaproteobacteria bacterium]|nr:exodeoxyribonuclease III [Deltaproteobacteria bacterium]
MHQCNKDIFTVATYNVNSIRSRLHIVIPWLLENKPSVLCMQETKVKDDAFATEEFTRIGYNIFFRGSGGYNGVAIASIDAPLEVLHGFPVNSEESDRIIITRFPLVTIINIYVPQGREKDSPQFAYKLAWFSRFEKMLKEHYISSESIIVCGDINVAPDAIDVHNPVRLLGHVCFNPEVWDVFEKWKQWGLTDVFRMFHPGESGEFSFYDYRTYDAVKKSIGWRIDHILATAPVLEKAIDCWIDVQPRLKEKPSDHTPVIAKFVL